MKKSKMLVMSIILCLNNHITLHAMQLENLTKTLVSLKAKSTELSSSLSNLTTTKPNTVTSGKSDEKITNELVEWITRNPWSLGTASVDKQDVATNIENYKKLGYYEAKEDDPIPNVSPLKSLEVFHVTVHQDNIPGLENLTNLETLESEAGSLKKIPNLSKLTKLKQIKLSSNNIDDISNLSTAVNVETIRLVENKGNLSDTQKTNITEQLKKLENFKKIEF